MNKRFHYTKLHVMQSLNFDLVEYFTLRRLMNHNFRVKVGRDLVGFSGFVLRVGFERAKALIQRTLRIRTDVMIWRTQFGVVTFYVK